MSSFLTFICAVGIVAAQSGDSRCSYQNGLLQCGSFSHPNDDIDNDPILITSFSEYNSTHFGLNVIIYGQHWFGFGFAQSGDSGCTLDSLDGECTMSGVDAIIFGNYGGTIDLAALEWTLGDNENGFLHASQDVGLESLSFDTVDGTFVYSGVIRRPYNPALYGDRNGYTITYPMVGTFCWLWAQGDGLSVSSTNGWAQALDSGHQCIDLGGTTMGPTPSPSYGPTRAPTGAPTPKPTKAPTIKGDTGNPSTSPTKEPTKGPTDDTDSPSLSPTKSPTYKPTVQEGEPTRQPTPEPTPFPTDQPTKAPTPSPTLEQGETKSPTLDPTPSPTTASPTTLQPTPSPTFISEGKKTNAAEDFLNSPLFYVAIGSAVLLFFCGALVCFWYKQKKRTDERREKREKMLTAEKYKQEHGLNIDADQNTKANRKLYRAKTKKNTLDVTADDVYSDGEDDNESDYYGTDSDFTEDRHDRDFRSGRDGDDDSGDEETGGRGGRLGKGHTKGHSTLVKSKGKFGGGRDLHKKKKKYKPKKGVKGRSRRNLRVDSNDDEEGSATEMTDTEEYDEY